MPPLTGSRAAGSWRLLTLGWLLAAAAPAAEPAAPALVIGEGSVAGRQVVALGRDLVVAGRALADVAAVSGSVEVSGVVAGDLIVLGGDARLLPSARVEGDVYVLGGRLVAEPGARIDGRAASYGSLGAAWLTLLEGPSLGLSPVSPLVLGAKLALLAAWLTLALVLLAVSGREVAGTSEAVGREPVRAFFLGLGAVLAMVLTALFVSALAPGLLGAPLLALVVLAALVLKLWGMVAVFHAVGARAVPALLRRRPTPLACAAAGLLLLGGLKLLPWVGTWVWTAATLIGIGASLTSKLGRREPWLEPGPPVFAA